MTITCYPTEKRYLEVATMFPQIYRKSVLHLHKYKFALYKKQMQYRFGVNLGTSVETVVRNNDKLSMGEKELAN